MIIIEEKFAGLLAQKLYLFNVGVVIKHLCIYSLNRDVTTAYVLTLWDKSFPFDALNPLHIMYYLV